MRSPMIRCHGTEQSLEVRETLPLRGAHSSRDVERLLGLSFVFPFLFVPTDRMSRLADHAALGT